MLKTIEELNLAIKPTDKHDATEEQKICRWNNYDNNAFYAEIKAEGLKKLAIKAGLLTGCDVRQLKPFWENSQSILDVGSGFGRVIAALLDEGFQGKITATERNREQLSYLSNNFNNKVRIIHTDIHELYNLNESFDTILFLWSGLADFPKYEQPEIMKLLSNLLSNDGKLIIDTMPLNIKPLDTEQFEIQSFLTRGKNTIVHTYEASYEEMQEYAKYSNLGKLNLIRCKTDTNRERCLYIFNKKVNHL